MQSRIFAKECTLMSQMDEAEQGRIALKMIKQNLKETSFPAPKDFRRELGNVAKKIDEAPETLLQFYIELLPEILGTMLGCSRVGITTSGKDLRPGSFD
jgi:hypothetical protein